MAQYMQPNVLPTTEEDLEKLGGASSVRELCDIWERDNDQEIKMQSANFQMLAKSQETSESLKLSLQDVGDGDSLISMDGENLKVRFFYLPNKGDGVSKKSFAGGDIDYGNLQVRGKVELDNTSGTDTYYVVQHFQTYHLISLDSQNYHMSWGAGQFLRLSNEELDVAPAAIGFNLQKKNGRFSFSVMSGLTALDGDFGSFKPETHFSIKFNL